MGVGSLDEVISLDDIEINGNARKLNNWVDLLIWINKLEGDAEVDQADLELWDKKLKDFGHL